MGPECSRAGGATSLGRLRVQRHGGGSERLPCLFVDLVAVMDIDGTPGVAFEAGVEGAPGVLERGAPGEGQLHDALVRLAGPDDSGVRPHRAPSTERRRAGTRAGQRVVGPKGKYPLSCAKAGSLHTPG